MEIEEMKTPGFTTEVSLFMTNVPYRITTRQAGLSSGQEVIPQSNCEVFAERAMQYVHLAWKASAQSYHGLAQQYLIEYQSWVALYQDCEASAHALTKFTILDQVNWIRSK
jgi:hypothetical protein